MKIVFPELKNKIIEQAVAECPEIEAIDAKDLYEACEILKNGQADAMIAGIDATSREVILTCREVLGMTGKTFSSCFVMENDLIVADVATCKNPNAEQLFDIVCQTWETAKKVLHEEPRVAMLSFSTLGSGGFDPSIDKIREVAARIKNERPEILIDGEMQLDAALNERVGAKKAPVSQVAGRANVLICPDLNSGNILYKAMEFFGKLSAAGPILQGFNGLVSDLSRGSTVEDVKLVIKMMEKLK